MTRGAIVENPSPFTPPRVYLEQGWIIADGGGRCAPISPCAGAGGWTSPSAPSPARGKCNGWLWAFRGTKPPFLGGCWRGGWGRAVGTRGCEQLGFITLAKQLMLISPSVYNAGGDQGICPRGLSPQILPCFPVDGRDLAFGSALTLWWGSPAPGRCSEPVPTLRLRCRAWQEGS